MIKTGYMLYLYGYSAQNPGPLKPGVLQAEEGQRCPPTALGGQHS